MTHRLRIVALVLVTAAALAACGDDGATATAPAEVATTTAATTAAPAATTAPSAPSTTTAPATTPPATTPPTTAAPATVSAAIVPGADPDIDAVVAAYRTVFDSAVPFEAKASFLADAEALRPTVDAYAATGARFGGIALQPTAVSITGDQAAVTYDVLFGTTVQYQGQSGQAVRQSGGWIVEREEFCSFMASARTPCPA